MISYLKGELIQVMEDKVVIDVRDIGYEVFLPTSAISKFPVIGSSITLHTYMHIRQDIMSLFGFLNIDDLEMFKLLITVNGIGPKGALGILSGLSSDEIRFAVLANDIATITKAPGIGKKTASKMVLELKDKFELSTAFEKKLQNQNADNLVDNNKILELKDEAVQALIVLGYSGAEALKQVNKVEIHDGMSSDEILKLSLKKM